jgi:aminoglycoside phosphotransferase (APT) family kinase protein
VAGNFFVESRIRCPVYRTAPNEEGESYYFPIVKTPNKKRINIMSVFDQAKSVRPGEELPLPALAAYLQRELSKPNAPLQVQQFPSGHSNLTYLLTFGEQELVLRRPPFGSKVKNAHDMGREFTILQKLAGIGAKVPKPLLYCEDEALMGAKFYVMERVKGVILRKTPPPGLVLTPALTTSLCEAFIDALSELHAIDYQACGLGAFGNPEGFVQRQVAGWSKRYLDAKTEEVAEIEELMRWFPANLPPAQAGTIIHNDYKYDNLVLDPTDITKIIAILDWEMSALGDPLMDLGTALCYWVEAKDPKPLQEVGFGPTAIPGSFTRRQLAERYRERSGRDIGHILFYYSFGLFKTAVVVQQIYYRFKQGLTKDPRFAHFHLITKLMAQQASQALSTGEL